MLKQISINSMWLFIGRVLSQGLNLIFLAIVARRLGVLAFGEYALFASILRIANFFTTYGADALLIREIARERRFSHSASTALWLQLTLSAAWVILVGIVCLFPIWDGWTRGAFFVLNLSLFPLSFQVTYNSVLRAFERMEISAGLNVFTLFMQALAAILLVAHPDDLLFLCIGYGVSQVISAFAGHFLCKWAVRDFALRERPVLTDVWAMFRSGWRLALLAPLLAMFQRLNLFVLTVFGGKELVGLLSAASRLLDGIKLGHFSVSNGMMPTMARPATPEADSSLRRSFYILLAWSTLAAAGISLFADLIIRIVFGAEYLPSVPVLRIMGWVLVPYTFSVYYSLKLTMRHREALVLRANLLALPLAVIIYSILIIKFGLLGSAWATLVSESAFVVIILLLRNNSPEAGQIASPVSS